MRLLLREAGVETSWEAADGAQALALFAEHKPELVILDVNLRMMTGLQVLQRIRQLQPGVLVIMMSSESAMKTVDEAVRLGADAYLLKHQPKTEALKALAAALDAAGAEEAD